MIQSRDKQLKKDACEMFKLLLQYMGDRKTKQKDVNLIALDITSQAWEKKGLRDELYIQLCRQTSSNSNPYVDVHIHLVINYVCWPVHVLWQAQNLLTWMMYIYIFSLSYVYVSVHIKLVFYWFHILAYKNLVKKWNRQLSRNVCIIIWQVCTQNRF